MRVAFGAGKTKALPGRGYCHKEGCPHGRATSMDGRTRLLESFYAAKFFRRLRVTTDLCTAPAILNFVRGAKLIDGR
jgi:hypothetical protein